MLRLALVCCSVVLAVLVAEGALRLFPAPPQLQGDPLVPDDGTLPPGKSWFDPDWGAPPASAYRADPLVGYDHAPSIDAHVRLAEHAGHGYRFKTNAFGLRRDTEIDLPKAAATWRALILGDSQTSGYGDNDETFPGRLEQAWQARAPGRSIEVLNSGVEGYGPLQMYLWTREHGSALAPDLVIMSLYVGNDLNDLAYPKIDSALVEEDAGLVGPLRTPWTWVGIHSELVRRVRPPLMARLREPLAALGMSVGPPDPPSGFDPLVRLLRECHGCWFQSLQQALRARTNPDDVERAVSRLELLIRVMSNRVAADGGQLAVLVIPTKTQVEPGDEAGAVNRAARLLELTPEDLGYDDVAYARVLDAARRAGVPAVDPLDELRTAATQRRLYYRRDWHLNPDGNRALAAALDRALTAAGLAELQAVPRGAAGFGR